MKKVINKNNIIRFLYIFCFYMFCWIDQICGSRNGRYQMIAVNSIGFLVAIIIFCNFKFKDFLRVEYYIWMGLSLIGAPLLIKYGMNNYNYPFQWATAVLEGFVYGFLIIRLVRYYLAEKHKIYEHFDKWALLGITLIFVLMLVSRNESVWYIYYFIVFASLMLTPMTDERREIMTDSMSTGVILGAVMIQGHAFLFRPYDVIRYQGFYTNPNINSILYVAAFIAILCKIYKLKTKESKIIWRILLFVFAALCVGVTVYTGCRTSLLTMSIIYFIFMIKYVNLMPKKKINRFLALSVLMVTLIAVCIYPAYCAIRYIPPLFHHPIWFDEEAYSEERVHSFDHVNSEKYVDFNEAIEEFGFRLLHSVVKAAEIELEEVPGSSQDNSMHPDYDVELFGNSTFVRQCIYQWYFENINILGHEKNNGVWLSPVVYYSHAHDIFLQMGYNFGILTVLAFIAFTVYLIVKAIKKHNEKHFEIVFALAFVLFSCLEVSWGRGQILFTLYFFAVKELMSIESDNKNDIKSKE